MKVPRFTSLQLIAALCAGALLAVVGYKWFRSPIADMPKFAVLYTDTATLFNVMEPDQTFMISEGVRDSTLEQMSGALMFKYYIQDKSVFNLHGWKLSQREGVTGLGFQNSPDIRLEKGFVLPGIKSLDGDYIGSFIFQKHELERIRMLCRSMGFPMVHFYPERRAGVPYISWKILLARFSPATQAFYSDTTQSSTYDAGQYNPIPPKGHNINSEDLNF